MSTQRGEQGAEPRELLVELDQPPRQLVGPFLAETTAARAVAQDRPQACLHPELLTLEGEGVRIAARQSVFDDRARRLLPVCGHVEERPDLGQHSGEAFVHGASIVRCPRRRDKGLPAYLLHRLGPWLAAVLGLLVLAAPAGAAEGTLATRLARALQVPYVDPGRTAALAVDLRTGTVVYSTNAELALVPASNQKLPVAYTALALLGPSYRFHTEIVGSGTLVGDVWHGDLWLRGYGDPTLETEDLAALAADVAAWGIRLVDGAVVADESWFDTRRTAPGWRARFYIHESPPLSALVVDRGWYRGRTSDNPALAAGSLLRQALERAGVRVAGRTRTGTLTTSGLPLARDVSVPLAEIVRFMGRESDNFTAELLVKQLGAVHVGLGSTAAGARVMRDALAAAEIPLAGVRFADGSGLSGLDRLTATAVVALLEAGLAAGELRDAFLDSLAVAGIDGTLEHRLQRRPARGQVIAKTGTTRLASALSGFVRDRYVFAILQNGSPVSSHWARVAQDRFVRALAAAG